MTTASTTHTPGPWVAVPNPKHMPSFRVSGFFRASVETNDSRHVLAYLPELGHEETNPELVANARLIAAAPELLDEAKALIGWLQGETGITSDLDLATHMLKLQMAISKAEGRGR